MVKAGEEEEVKNNDDDYPLALAPSSSSTLEEQRGPDLMRHVQAALKRHRPLGSMQASSNIIRPRRILREPSRVLKSNNKLTEKKKHHDDDATPPSATETLSQEYNAVSTQKKVQFSPGDNAILSHHEVADAKRRSMLMQNSSCITTISLHSKSAPALNSTTYNSQPRHNGISHMDIQLEDHHLDPPPMLSHPTISLGAAAADQGPPKEHPANTNDRLVEGQIDQANASSLLHQKGNHADVIDLQSHAPITKTTCTSVNVESSKSDKPDKSATQKQISGPPKKNYDPDIFVKVNGKLYQKLGKIGSGGSSEVYKVITSECTIYALKRIKLKGRDYSTAYGFCQEIEYLKKLKGKNNIIQLIDYEVTDRTLLEEVTSGAMNVKDSRIREDGYIYMVLEYGEIDLAHMLSHKWKEQDSANWTMDENWLRFYWQEILQAVKTIHEERIVHSDLKPANFLFVKGSLKLIDFGIAKAIMSDTTNIQRDSQVGTLSYMSPEAFMCNENDSQGNAIKCGRPSDIWSLGCILYQMVYGRTPFAEYKTFWAKFKVITDRNHEIKYGPVSNPWLLDLMKKCLAWERKDRWRIPELLRHHFLVPPITPSLHRSNQGLDLLEQISETHGNDDETFRLCSQLQTLLSGSTESSQLSRVSQMLNLWSQLQQRLTSIQS